MLPKAAITIPAAAMLIGATASFAGSAGFAANNPALVPGLTSQENPGVVSNTMSDPLTAPVQGGGYAPPSIDATVPPAQFPYYHPPVAPRAVGGINSPWKSDASGPAAAWCRYSAIAPGC